MWKNCDYKIDHTHRKHAVVTASKCALIMQYNGIEAEWLMFLCLWQKRCLKESFFWHKGVIDNHNLQRKNVPVHHFIPWIFLSPFSVTNKNPVSFQFSWSPTVACFITSLFMTEPNHNYLKAESLIFWYQVSDSHSWPNFAK